jgi:hypothetical protein
VERGIIWLPPYLGDYDHLLKALINNPFLGIGRYGSHPPHLQQALRSTDPQPLPWRASSPLVSAAVEGFVSAAVAKTTVDGMSDKGAGKQIKEAADAAIAQLFDDYCGTPPKKWPWPYPGPPPWVWLITSELTAAAHSYQEGRSGASC